MKIDPNEIKSIEDSMVHDVEEEKDVRESKSPVYLVVGLSVLVVGILGIVLIWLFRAELH